MQKIRSRIAGKRPSITISVLRCRGFLLFALLGLALTFTHAQSAYAAGFSATAGSMVTVRQNHTTTVLDDGRVLITGGTLVGSPVNSAEIYDPTTGDFIATGNMHFARRNHSATKLSDGRVLIVGGYSGTTYYATAEIFDPSGNGGVGAFTDTGSMATTRSNLTATLIGTKVLVAGGYNSTTTHQSAEIFDPAGNSGAGAFTATGNMTSARRLHTATPISGGRVLIAGGRSGSTSSTGTNTAEIFDPAGSGGAGAFTLVAATMTSKRDTHSAALLSDGRVLIVGGFTNTPAFTYLTTAEIFDPAGAAGAGTFTATGSMSKAHYAGTATRLPSGKVLIAGGFDSFASTTPSAAAELFSLAGGSFTSAGTMTAARQYYAAVPLTNGTILLAGGNDPTIISNSAEIYNPAAIEATPPFFTFEDTFETTTSSPQSFTIRNTGSSSLQLNSIAISGSDFALSGGTCAPPQTLSASGSCTVNVVFAPAYDGSKSASLVINSNDAEIPVLSVPLRGYGIAIFTQHTVTVNFAGTGAGSTSSAIAGLNCLSPTSCQADVDNGTTVTLTPKGDSNSLFKIWSSVPASAGCSGSGDCVITVNTDTTVTATFDFVKPAKNVRTGLTYDTLQNAYNNSISNDEIRTRDVTFSESPPLNLAGGITITITGGCDLSYSPNVSNYSTIGGGSLTITSGQVTLANIIIQ